MADDPRGVIHKADRVTHETVANPWAIALMRLGYAAKGLVYVILGGLAVKYAVGAGGAVTDPKGALHAVDIGLFGHILLGIVAAGLLGYMLWNLARALLDLDHRGKDAKGIMLRIGFGVVALAYATLAFAAFQLATSMGNGGKSSDATTQDWTGRFLNTPLGVPLVILGGVILIVVAGALAVEAYRARFRRYIKSTNLPEVAEQGLVLAGRFGYAAMSVVLAIIGIFLIVAATQHNPGEAKGLGGALQQLTQAPMGPVLLGVVAIGLIAYGAFSLACTYYRRLGSA
jgi:type IV secretory pathway VirB2 component (pilin)